MMLFMHIYIYTAGSMVILTIVIRCCKLLSRFSIKDAQLLICLDLGPKHRYVGTCWNYTDNG